MNENDGVTTADQDAWVSLIEAVRVELSKSVPLMGAMKPDEQKVLVDTIQACMWSHFHATTFDKRVELELRKITAD